MPDSPTPSDRAPRTYGGKTEQELRALHEAAMSEPWEEYADGDEWWISGGADDEPEKQGFVCYSGTPHIWAEQADIDLTVAARNALPDLLAALEAAEATITNKEAALEAYRVENEQLRSAIKEALDEYDYERHYDAIGEVMARPLRAALGDQ